ncbi:MAG: hypothetical protein ABI784_07655 [Ginsengibacter sp.]
MKAGLIKKIKKILNRLIAVISLFSEAEIIADKSYGNWTTVQASNHIIKSMEGFPYLCYGNTEKANQIRNKKVDQIRNMFLDFSSKMETRELLKPSEKNHNKEESFWRLKN